MNITELYPVEQNGQRVLLTSQLAEAYETTTDSITKNFNRNKEHYQEGKHYFTLEGEDLKEFKETTYQSVTSSILTKGQIVPSSIRINKLYLWTERGALLHAKSLNTDKAWEVYEYLVETYFRVKELTMQSKQDSATSAVMAQQMENELIKTKLEAIKLATSIMDKANITPEYQALSLMKIFNEISIEIPRIALQSVKKVYDKTTIADKLGILSSSKKPHALAVGAIISQLVIDPCEMEETPYYRNGHDGFDTQYTESVIDKIKQWLNDNNYPTQVIMSNGNKAIIYYR